MTKRELIEALEALDVADNAPILCRDFDRDGEMIGVSEASELCVLPVTPHTSDPAWGGAMITVYRNIGEETFKSVPGIVIDF
jgi:hypothetical protein